MKNKKFFFEILLVMIVLFVLSSTKIYSQSIYVDCFADGTIRIGTGGACATWATSNFGNATTTQVMKWTWHTSPHNCSNWGAVRSLFWFDLIVPTDPQRLYDNSASLYLYFPTGSSETQYSVNTNNFYVERITQNWAENIVTWNTQPATSTVNRVTVPNSTSTTQNYVIDISAMALQWICDGVPNYGVKLTLVNESSDTYKRVSLATREHATSSLHPKLRLEYARIQASHTFCSGGDFLVLSTTLTNANNPGVYNFSWVHVNSGTTHTGQNWINPPLTGGTNTYTVTATNPWCQTATHTINVSAPTAGGNITWVGSYDTNWFNPCNWSSLSVPTQLNNVTIPGATPFQPTITGAMGHCNTIEINSTNGAVLTIQQTAGGSLQVHQ
jgi:hypothetical protein